MKKEEIISEILDIINNVDDFTTSDLQGAIEVQVIKAIRLGFELGEDYGELEDTMKTL